ncbi:MAG: 30S ribosomal protein S16 [Niabella sp.]|nr:MAG: 30S ribosomal protein S16 [Niabella sp.]
MVKIRLTRTGRKNAPSFRIIVIDSRSKRDGMYIEKLGYYNPTENDKNVVYSKERYDHWLSVGAQPSDAVKKLVSGKYVFKKTRGKKEEPAAEAPAEPKTEAPATETAAA